MGKRRGGGVARGPRGFGRIEGEDELIQPLEILEVEIGYGLIPIVDAEQNGELLDKIRAIRKQIAVELGIVVPPMKLRDNLQLGAREAVVPLRE